MAVAACSLPKEGTWGLQLFGNHTSPLQEPHRFITAYGTHAPSAELTPTEHPGSCGHDLSLSSVSLSVALFPLSAFFSILLQ